MTYSIVERKVKNPRLEFKNGELFAIVPFGRSYLAESMVQNHLPWIKRHMAKHQLVQDKVGSLALEKISEAKLAQLIHEYIARAAKLLGKAPRQITYRTMKRRWGSCSVSGDLVFNKNLAFVPEELIWYVVFHEMCHLLVHAHNKKFNDLMRTQFADVRSCKQQLRAYSLAIEKLKETNS